MKFKCKDCGKIYLDVKPEYCQCGNNEFSKILTKEEREEQLAAQNQQPSEKKEKNESVFAILFFFVAIIAIVFVVRHFVNLSQNRVDLDAEYLTNIREEMLKDFDPEGIVKSGECIISFEINAEGWITKRYFVKKSPVNELNDKVMSMLKKATIVEKPPKIWTNTPIKLLFRCVASETEVECESKNIIERPKQ